MLHPPKRRATCFCSYLAFWANHLKNNVLSKLLKLLYGYFLIVNIQIQILLNLHVTECYFLEDSIDPSSLSTLLERDLIVSEKS